jgi:Di-haem oxidoreductase, putative peroxidase
LLRVDQSGRVLARARVVVPGLGVIGANQLRGLAVSSDAQRIWLTLPGPVPGYPEGVLVEVSAFDVAGPYRAQPQPPLTALDPDVVNRGAILFAKEFTPAEGLGPLFNARACVTCHSQPGTGGMSDREEHFAVRVAQVDPVSGRALPLHDMNSPVARRHSNRELGQASAPLARIPREANITSMRMPPALYELGLIEQIPDEAILAQAYNKGDGVHGRPNRVTTARGEQRIGRYGWKANVASLDEMVANAFVNELGIPSPLALALAAPGVPASENTGHEANRGLIDAVTAYLRALRLPPPKTPP